MITCPTTGYPYRIPVYPQPGFFETTVVTHEFEDGKGYTYGPDDYARQREMRFGTFDILDSNSANSMLDDGWSPQLIPSGGLITGMVLVPPSPEVRAEMARLAEENDRADFAMDDVPNPSPGRQAVKKAAAKRAPAKKPGGRTQGGSEAGWYS